MVGTTANRRATDAEDHAMPVFLRLKNSGGAQIDSRAASIASLNSSIWRIADALIPRPSAFCKPPPAAKGWVGTELLPAIHRQR
jgi:hypothetical protein